MFGRINTTTYFQHWLKLSIDCTSQTSHQPDQSTGMKTLLYHSLSFSLLFDCIIAWTLFRFINFLSLFRLFIVIALAHIWDTSFCINFRLFQNHRELKCRIFFAVLSPPVMICHTTCLFVLYECWGKYYTIFDATNQRMGFGVASTEAVESDEIILMQSAIRKKAHEPWRWNH